MDYLRDIIRAHAAKIAPYTGEPAGCPEEEIASLEHRLGFKLPMAYVQFLRWMGRDTQGMFAGSDCFIHHVERNTRYLPKLLAKNGIEFRLPEHYLAFFSHQGYQMVWFALPPDSDDPACWGFCEGHTPEPQPMGKFTEWLRRCLKDEAKAIAMLWSRRE
jgi:hypothetical protein